MKDLTKAEALAFLMSKPRTGKLASVRQDGRPHIAPIWFIVDGDDLIFTTWYATVKAANLRADQRVSLCVDDDTPPYAFVIIEGVAHVQETPDPATMLHWTTALARRYMGDALAESYGKRNAVVGEWLIRLTPTKIVAKSGISD